MFNDTICAVATPPGNGGISIIRVSGDNSVDCVSSLFYKGDKPFDLKNADSHTIHYGYIKFDNKIIDEVLVSVFLKPKSYTTEDVVEINCHGGMITTKNIIDSLLKSGIRLADPGEFTKRAFLNGRIDLSQAEAVIDVINAENDFSVDNSLAGLKGNVKLLISELREEIIHYTAFIESAMDDPEHYSLDGFYDELKSKLSDFSDRIKNIINTSLNGSIVKNGVKTVIAGKPNSGKSSLLNYLSGFERAIVTDVPGTTRDTVTETIVLNDITLKLIDTAGIRNTDDVVEMIGVKKSFENIDISDLILYVVDLSMDLSDDDYKIISRIKNKNSIIVFNKDDLKCDKNIDAEVLSLIDKPCIYISAKNQTGIDGLYNIVYDIFLKDISNMNDVIITNMRQIDCLRKAAGSIDNALKSVSLNMPEDIIAVDLMDTYKYLGLVIGENIEDDLVDKIFSEFCMGK